MGRCGPGSCPWGVTGTQHILTETPTTHDLGGQTLEPEGPTFSPLPSDRRHPLPDGNLANKPIGVAAVPAFSSLSTKPLTPLCTPQTVCEAFPGRTVHGRHCLRSEVQRPPRAQNQVDCPLGGCVVWGCGQSGHRFHVAPAGVLSAVASPRWLSG